MKRFVDIAILVVVALLLYLGRNLRFTHWPWSSGPERLPQILPVFSAETTRRREAEFIDERLRKRTSKWITIGSVALLIAGYCAFLLTR